MVDIQGFLTSNGKILELAKDVEVLKDVAELWQQWPAISEAIKELGEPKTLDQWIAMVVAGIESDEVKQVLAKAKLDGLQARLAAWLEKIPENDRRKIMILLRPLDSFGDGGTDDVVKFPLLHLSPSGGSGNWSFSLEGSAALEIEANARWTYRSDSVADGLLRLALACDGSAEASAKLPLQFLSLSAKAGTEQSITLAQYFAPKDRSIPYALGAARAVDGLANPLSFHSAWSRLSSADSGLSGVTLDYNGSLSFSVGLGIDHSIQTDYVDVAASVTLDVGIKRPAQFSLSLRRGAPLSTFAGMEHLAGDSMLFTLTRKTSLVSTVSAGAELKLDLSKAAKTLHDILQKGLRKWESGLEAIKDFLTPGTYLRQHLGEELGKAAAKLISDPKLRSAFEDDARIALGLDSGTDSALSGWLVGLIADKAETYAGGFASDAEAAVDRVTDRILDELPAIAFMGSSVTDPVKAEVKKLIDGLLGKFEAKAKEIYNGVKDDAAKQVELGDALSRIGEVSNDAVKKLDDLLEPLRKIVKQYDDWFHILLAATEKKARTEITASLSYEDIHDSGTNFEFSGTFLAGTDELAKLYRTLLSGGYQAVYERLSGATQVSGFILDPKSSVGRYSARTTSWGFKLKLFGLGISSKETLSSKAAPTVSGDGTVTLDLRGTAIREVGKGDNTRSFEFVSAGRIRALREMEDSNPALLAEQSLAFTMQFVEKKLTRGELRDMLHALSAVPFIAGGAPGSPYLLTATGQASALANFDGWVVNPGEDANVPASIEFRLSLGAELVVASLSRPVAEADLFDLAMHQFATNGVFDAAEWAEFCGKVRAFDSSHKKALPADAPPETRDYRPMLAADFPKLDRIKQTPGPHGTQMVAPGHETVRQAIGYAKSFVALAKAMADIYRIKPTGGQEFDIKQGSKLERAIAGAVQNIVSTGAGSASEFVHIGHIFRFDRGVSPRTITFVQLLHYFFGLDRSRLALTVKWLEGDTTKDSIMVG